MSDEIRVCVREIRQRGVYVCVCDREYVHRCVMAQKERSEDILQLLARLTKFPGPSSHVTLAMA